VTLSVMSDSLSLPSSRSMFGDVGRFEELDMDMDMFKIMISLFVIA
jgi:hypothetical protein